MKRMSPRLVLGFTTLFIILGAVLALALSQGGPQPKPYTPADVAAGNAPVGREIVIAGVVVSQAERALVLRPDGASSPTVTVVLSAKSAQVRFGEGSHVAARGITTQGGSIVGASVIGPSPPSKYKSATTTE